MSGMRPSLARHPNNNNQNMNNNNQRLVRPTGLRQQVAGQHRTANQQNNINNRYNPPSTGWRHNQPVEHGAGTRWQQCRGPPPGGAGQSPAAPHQAQSPAAPHRAQSAGANPWSTPNTHTPSRQRPMCGTTPRFAHQSAPYMQEEHMHMSDGYTPHGNQPRRQRAGGMPGPMNDVPAVQAFGDPVTPAQLYGNTPNHSQRFGHHVTSALPYSTPVYSYDNHMDFDRPYSNQMGPAHMNSDSLLSDPYQYGEPNQYGELNQYGEPKQYGEHHRYSEHHQYGTPMQQDSFSSGYQFRQDMDTAHQSNTWRNDSGAGADSTTQTQAENAMEDVKVAQKSDSGPSLRVVSATIEGMKYWANYRHKAPMLFQLIATLGSAVSTDRVLNCHHFLLTDDKDSIQTIFYNIDRDMPGVTRSQTYRCVGRMKDEAQFQCLSIRPANESERRLHKATVSLCDKHLRKWVRSLTQS